MIHQKILNVKSKIGTIGKDAFNKFGSYKYVTLDKIFDRLEPLLIQEKLSVYLKEWEFDRTIDVMRKGKEGTYTVTLVMYKVTAEIIDTTSETTDDKVTFTFNVPMDSAQENFIQAFGSTTTYLRKYALAIMFDISFGDEDDPDRTQGSDAGTTSAPTTSKKFEDLKKTTAYADKKQQRQIYNAQITAKVSDGKLAEIINTCGGSDWEDIPADQVSTIIKLIEENKRP